MQKPLHLYLVFNPMMNSGQSSYMSQAHEFYSELKKKQKLNLGESSSMFWGKISFDQNQSFDCARYNKIIEDNKKLGRDTHLYITDYHHFWVAKLESVHDKNINHKDTIAFYDNKKVSAWFEISDMDLLSAEFPETSFYLSELYVDNAYQEQNIPKLSPYVGGLSFPLVIQDRLNEAYFNKNFVEDTLRVVRDNPLVEFPQIATQVKASVNSFVLPRHIYSSLSQDIKDDLIAVETLFAKENIESCKTKVANSYVRILENLVNKTIGETLKTELGDCLFISEDGRLIKDVNFKNSIRLSEFHKNISIGCFLNLGKDVQGFGNLSLEKIKKYHPELLSFFEDELVPFLQEFEIGSLRNQLFSGEEIKISPEKVLAIRNKILGVGCLGIINSLVTSLFERYSLTNAKIDAA